MFSTKFAFLCRLEKCDGHPDLWFAETFLTSLTLLNEIQRNLIGSKMSTSSTKFVFFRADRQKQDGRAGVWLADKFSTSPLKPLNEIPRQLTGSNISTFSTMFAFLCRLEKYDGHPDLWYAETFLTSLKLLNRIQRNLIWSKMSTSSTKFVFFGTIGKSKMAALASEWPRHFRLLLWLRWTEISETWQKARSQRPLPSPCFLTDQ